MWLFRRSVPFTLGNEVQTFSGDLVVKLFNGTRNSDNIEVSIFQLNPNNELSNDLAQNLIKSWKTFRHPIIPSFIDTYEDGGKTHIVTEKIEPFREEEFSDCELVWAIHIMTQFISFLGESSNTIHGNLVESSLFQTKGHELKIAGLQWLTQNEQGPIRDHYSQWLRSNPLNSINIPDGSPRYALDTYYIANYIKKWANRMPKEILKFGHKWIKPSRSIPPPNKLLELDFWKTDKFSQILTGLRELALKDQSGREQFYAGLAESIDLFSVQMQISTILPLLKGALSYSPTPSILEPIFSIGEKMDTTEFANNVAPGLVDLFTTKNPTIKVVLLSHISLFCSTVERATINEKIFPNVISGLSDQLPSVRQTTIIAMSLMAASLNKDSMAILIRSIKNIQTQNDAQMRANTVICIVKIAEHLDPESRPNTLLHVFGKAAVDPFPPARRAAVAAYRNCAEYFDERMMAAAILPAIGPLCADPVDDVRINALKLLRYITETLCKADAAALDEPVHHPEAPKEKKEKEVPKESVQIKKPTRSAEDAWNDPLSESEDEKPKKIVKRNTNKKVTPIRTTKKVTPVDDDGDGWEDDDFEDDINLNDEEFAAKHPGKVRVENIVPSPVEVEDLIELTPATKTTKQNARPARKAFARPVKTKAPTVEDEKDGWDDIDDIDDDNSKIKKPSKPARTNPIRQTKPKSGSSSEDLHQSAPTSAAVQPSKIIEEEKKVRPESHVPVSAAETKAKPAKVTASRTKVVHKLSKKGPKVVKIDSNDGWDDEDWEDI